MLLWVIIENSEKIFHHFGMPEKLDFFHFKLINK